MKKKSLILTTIMISALPCAPVNASELKMTEASIYDVSYEVPVDWYGSHEDVTAIGIEQGSINSYTADLTTGKGLRVMYTIFEGSPTLNELNLYLDFTISNLFESEEDYTELMNEDCSLGDLPGKCITFTSTFAGNTYVNDSLALNTGTGIFLAQYSYPADLETDFDQTFFYDIFCSTVSMDILGESTPSTDLSSSSNQEQASSNTDYAPGMYKVGTDIPSGEYVVFASDDNTGYFCVSADSNQNDIYFNDSFNYNSIITVQDGEYLELSRCHAISITEDPEVNTTSSGMFKVGVHIPSGEYKIESTYGSGYYCIYSDSRQSDIIANNGFEGQSYVTVKDGQYLLLSRCKFAVPPEKPLKSYSDTEVVKKTQEALNAAGYNCGTPDGIIGNGTKTAIEKYQADKSLTVTGTITDELLNALGI